LGQLLPKCSARSIPLTQGRCSLTNRHSSGARRDSEPYLDKHDIAAAGEDWETRLGRSIEADGNSLAATK
jgi:hypothetical protein